MTDRYIYVCFEDDVDGDGYGVPYVAFTTQKRADAWVSRRSFPDAWRVDAVPLNPAKDLA